MCQNFTMRIGMRRFTRLTNGFFKQIENHAHPISLHFMHSNFGRPHKTLGKGVTPAMAAGIERAPWSLTQIAERLTNAMGFIGRWWSTITPRCKRRLKIAAAVLAVAFAYMLAVGAYGVVLYTAATIFVMVVVGEWLIARTRPKSN